jgi:hypothetical protein
MKLLCRYFLVMLAAAHRRTLDGASASRSRAAGTIRTTVKDISVIRTESCALWQCEHSHGGAFCQ